MNSGVYRFTATFPLHTTEWVHRTTPPTRTCTWFIHYLTPPRRCTSDPLPRWGAHHSITGLAAATRTLLRTFPTTPAFEPGCCAARLYAHTTPAGKAAPAYFKIPAVCHVLWDMEVLTGGSPLGYAAWRPLYRCGRSCSRSPFPAARLRNAGTQTSLDIRLRFLRTSVTMVTDSHFFAFLRHAACRCNRYTIRTP